MNKRQEQRIDWSDERGVSAVEFAVILSVLVILVFGAVEFGLALSKLEVLEAASREGGRHAALGLESADSIRDLVVDAASGYTIEPGPIAIKVDGKNVSPSQKPCRDVPGNRVYVSWPQSFDLEVPFLPSWNISRTIQAVFRCEP